MSGPSAVATARIFARDPRTCANRPGAWPHRLRRCDMAHGTCTICGAEGRVKRGWCTKHYQRWLAHGDPLWEPKRKDPSQYDSTGHRIHPKICPACSIEFMGRTDQVHCSPACPHRGKKRPGTGLAGEANHLWRGDDVGYHGMHIRVYKARGKADHCVRCGAGDPSLNFDWASLVDRPTSVDDFAPMCRSCHRRFDIERDRQRPGYEGTRNGRKRVLTADVVREAKAAFRAGVPLGELAARFDIRRETLRRAVKGEAWGWVDSARPGDAT